MQLMRPGMDQNMSCVVGDCITSRPGFYSGRCGSLIVCTYCWVDILLFREMWFVDCLYILLGGHILSSSHVCWNHWDADHTLLSISIYSRGVCPEHGLRCLLFAYSTLVITFHR